MPNIKAKNKLHSDLLDINLPYQQFQDYLDFIFNKSIKFYINNKLVDKEDYIIGDSVSIKKDDFVDSLHDSHKLYFALYNIKSEKSNVNIFIQSQVNHFSTIIGSFKLTYYFSQSNKGSFYEINCVYSCISNVFTGQRTEQRTN